MIKTIAPFLINFLSRISDPNHLIRKRKIRQFFNKERSLVEVHGTGSSQRIDVLTEAGLTISYEVGPITSESNIHEVGNWFFRFESDSESFTEREGTADEMLSLYKKAYKAQDTSSGSIKGRVFKTLGVGVAGLFIYILASAVMMGTPATKSAEAPADAPKLVSTPEALGKPSLSGVQDAEVLLAQALKSGATAKELKDHDPSQPPKEARITDEERKLISSAPGQVALTAGTTPFYVFSDPLCPHCRRTEVSIDDAMKAVPGKYKAVVIPVAYQKGSREILAAMFCTSEKAKSWKKVVAEGGISSPTCAAGFAMVDANNKLFETMRLGSTPSLVSPGGLLFSGYADAAQIANILRY